MCAEDVDLAELADQAGTPLYVYSTAALRRRFEGFSGACPPGTLVAYSVKANGNLAVLKTLARLGAGADVVSSGELKRALAAGIPADKIVFSGVGKSAVEMRLALEAGIFQFNVESEPELETLNAVARDLGREAPVAIRVNPDVDAGTHAKITTGTADTKFGIPLDRAIQAYRHAARLEHLKVVGVDVHIGSQIHRLEPFEAACARLMELVRQLRNDGHEISRADIGGGLGIGYESGATVPDVQAYGRIANRLQSELGVALIAEPGRYIAAEAGLLLARVRYVKAGAAKTFAILDAGMNDLLRPALYGAYHEIVPVTEPGSGLASETYDIVGPVCETADLFASGRILPLLERGDLVAIMAAGAYGAAMSSAYNSRPPAAEVLVNGADWSVVRPRLSDDALVALDRLPAWLEG
jgi:diaminopimelate decarboxylase